MDHELNYNNQFKSSSINLIQERLFNTFSLLFPSENQVSIINHFNDKLHETIKFMINLNILHRNHYLF